MHLELVPRSQVRNPRAPKGVRKVARTPIPEIDAKTLEGKRVTVHYNLTKCKPGRDPKPGETCFVIRDKPGGKTIGYTVKVALKDVEPVIYPKTIARIRKKTSTTGRPQREVCCFLRGTIIPASQVKGKKEVGSFNPFTSPCFYLRSNKRCVDSAKFAVLDGRTLSFVGAQTSPQSAAKHDIPNPRRASIPELDPAALVGQRISVHYNLQRCRPGQEPTGPESCFVVSDKPGGRVMGYVQSIALEDVEPKIYKREIRRIRDRERRKVCCYIVGTVVPMRAVKGKQIKVSFNPFRLPCFGVKNEKCVDAAKYAVFKGRDMWVVSPETSDVSDEKNRVNPERAREVRRIMRSFMRL